MKREEKKLINEYKKKAIYTKQSTKKKIDHLIDQIFIEKKTSQEIAKKRKVSRQAILQFLKAHVPGIVIPNNYQKRTVYLTIKCTECGKEFQTTKSHENYLKRTRKASVRYCSTKCYKKYKKTHSKYYKLTKKEIRKINADRFRAYYQKNKHTPKFKQRIKDMNEKARIKRLNSII